jgi:hypothetical protein
MGNIMKKLISWFTTFFLIISPAYAQNRVSNFRVSGSTSGTTIQTLAPALLNLKYYITDIECGRTDTGTAALYVTLSDSSPSYIVIPTLSGGGGSLVFQFATPLVTPVNTALTFQLGSSVTGGNVYCNFQGFTGQ